jgi:hypothetical protein
MIHMSRSHHGRKRRAYLGLEPVDVLTAAVLSQRIPDRRARPVHPHHRRASACSQCRGDQSVRRGRTWSSVRGRGAPAVTTSRPKRCGSSGAGRFGETHLSHIRPAATSDCPRVDAAGRVHYKRGPPPAPAQVGAPRPIARSETGPCFRVLHFRSGGQRCSHPGRWKDEGIGRERLGDPVAEGVQPRQRQDLAAGPTDVSVGSSS